MQEFVSSSLCESTHEKRFWKRNTRAGIVYVIVKIIIN